MRRSIIAVLSLLCIEANQASAYKVPTTETDFYVPDLPATLYLYISTPQIVCKSLPPNMSCSVPIPADGIIDSPIQGHVVFSTYDNTKWCSYDFFVIYNMKYGVYDMGTPVLSYKNMNCDATLQQAGNGNNEYRVNY